MKIEESTFYGQNSGEGGKQRHWDGGKLIFVIVGGSPGSLPLKETPKRLLKVFRIFCATFVQFWQHISRLRKCLSVWRQWVQGLFSKLFWVAPQAIVYVCKWSKSSSKIFKISNWLLMEFCNKNSDNFWPFLQSKQLSMEYTMKILFLFLFIYSL